MVAPLWRVNVSTGTGITAAGRAGIVTGTTGATGTTGGAETGTGVGATGAASGCAGVTVPGVGSATVVAVAVDDPAHQRPGRLAEGAANAVRGR